jgi:hypothetical protein
MMAVASDSLSGGTKTSAFTILGIKYNFIVFKSVLLIRMDRKLLADLDR